jgi:predicted transcriptional regulator
VDEDRALDELPQDGRVGVVEPPQLQAALPGLVRSELGQLRVVDGGRVVGICTRTDLLQVRLRELDQERIERGWLPARLPSIGS